MTNPIAARPGQKTAPPQHRLWAPRMWEGCNLLAWLRLLWRGRFAVHWSCWHIAIVITCVSLWNTLIRLIQDAVYGSRIRRTVLPQPPIFIVGHWRTGTTLLHELLVQDERHGFPTTFECMDPNHFLLTEGFFTRWLHWLMPTRRPMDNMAAGFQRPQEDEFALCMLGEPSPYLTVAFPNGGPLCDDYLDLEGLPPAALRKWQRTLYRFLQRITFRNPKRLVLKSPPHTARLKVLHELFPEAIFIHIVRDPYVVFPSTVNLWKTLYRSQGLQKPTFAGLEEYVYTTFLRLYDRLEEGRALIAPERFYELKYEDLIRDPVEELRQLYEHLHLDGFAEMEPRLRNYLESVAGYETNKYQLTAEQRAEIGRRWGPVIERYGYGTPVLSGAARMQSARAM